jgi:hypothetical protein
LRGGGEGGEKEGKRKRRRTGSGQMKEFEGRKEG